MLICRDQLTVGAHHAQGWCHNYSDPLNKTMGGCNGLSPVESESMMSFWCAHQTTQRLGRIKWPRVTPTLRHSVTVARSLGRCVADHGHGVAVQVDVRIADAALLTIMFLHHTVNTIFGMTSAFSAVPVSVTAVPQRPRCE